MTVYEPIRAVLVRPARAAVVVLAHLALGTLVTVGIWVTELLFHWLWAAEHMPRFFGWIPVKWLFDASELGVMLVFVCCGTWEAFLTLRPPVNHGERDAN
jgi:hypothetical protein